MKKVYYAILFFLIPLATSAQTKKPYTNTTKSDSTGQKVAAKIASQKKPTVSIKNQMVSLSKDSLILGLLRDFMDINNKLEALETKSTTTTKLENKTQSDSIFGYIKMLPKTQIKIYKDNILYSNKTIIDSIKQKNAKGGDLAVNIAASQLTISIDEIHLYIQNNHITRTILLCGQEVYQSNYPIKFEDINDASTLIPFKMNALNLQFRINDFLRYVPWHDDKIVKEDIYVINPSSTITLQLQYN